MYCVRVFSGGVEFNFSYASGHAALAAAMDAARAMGGHVLGGLRQSILSVVPVLPIF